MKKFLIWAVTLAFLVGGIGVVAVVNPPVADSAFGDALIVHPGGRGERLTSGLALMANDTAPIMVLMNGSEPGWPEANGLCDQTDPYIVICPEARPENTIGEAAALGELIEEQQWRSVVVVTSDYHLRRTTMLDRACVGEDVALRGVGAPADISTTLRIALITREVLALPQALLSGCR